MVRRVFFSAMGFVVACGASNAKPVDDESSIKKKHEIVQFLACYRDAVESGCTPRARAAFGPFAKPNDTIALYESPRLRSGEIWCENGKPWGRFTTTAKPDETIEGELPQVVWESIWRVLDSAGCATVDRMPLRVTRNGIHVSCDSPKFEMRDLFYTAQGAAKAGPPKAKRVSAWSSGDEGGGGICDIDPSACPKAESRGGCPAFTGDYWNGVTRPADADASAAAASGRGAAPPDEQPIDAPDVAPRGKPPQAEVTAAMARVIPAAKRCVAEGTPISRARVTFLPSGATQSVVVEGGAAGRSAEACIKAALGKARVSPFEGPPYVVSITVR